MKFWGREVERIDLKEIVDVLSVIGGVPRYLEENRMLPNDVAKMAEAYGGRAAECRARHVPRARRLCPRPWAVDRAAMENESCAKKWALRGI